MTTLKRILELETKVNEAITFNADGRQTVADACKELYNLVEEDYHKVGADSIIDDMYKDLTAGNFAAPYKCELKKNRFLLYKKIYIDNVIPRLTK